jgi:hypothetical protein
MTNSLAAPFATIAPGVASAPWTVEIVGSFAAACSLSRAELGPVNVSADSAKDIVKCDCLSYIGVSLF